MKHSRQAAFSPRQTSRHGNSFLLGLRKGLELYFIGHALPVVVGMVAGVRAARHELPEALALIALALGCVWASREQAARLAIEELTKDQ